MGLSVEAEPRTVATLVVDDDPLMRDLVRSILEDIDGRYRVVTAADPGSALNYARVLQLRLIITDNRMPHPGAGLKLIRDLGEFPHLSKAGVILMSGTMEDLTVDDKQLFAARGWGTLRKPFNINAMVNLAEQQVRGASGGFQQALR